MKKNTIKKIGKIAAISLKDKVFNSMAAHQTTRVAGVFPVTMRVRSGDTTIIIKGNISTTESNKYITSSSASSSSSSSRKSSSLVTHKRGILSLSQSRSYHSSAAIKSINNPNNNNQSSNIPIHPHQQTNTNTNTNVTKDPNANSTTITNNNNNNNDSNNNNKGKPGALSKAFTKATQYVKRYGVVGVITYGTMYVGTLGSFYWVFAGGILNFEDLRSLISELGLSSWFDKTELNPKVGTFGLAWIMTKLTEPLRFAITLAITPRLYRLWHRRDALPVDEESLDESPSTAVLDNNNSTQPQPQPQQQQQQPQQQQN